jgi:uncharacterized RDD family membrane protein YckC
MQMTTDARAWLDTTVRRILARHPLDDAERAEVMVELMSHLHAAGEARAAAADRGEVTRADLEAALAEAGGDEGLAAAFALPVAPPVERALVGRRLGAFALDALLLGIALTFVHGALESLLGPLMGGTGSVSHYVEPWWWLVPWGHHDHTLPAALQAVIVLASAATVLGYFTWFEAHDGRTPGKRALDLRVMRVDGRPMTRHEALIRNLVKVAPPLLVLDTLIMLLAFGDDHQRVSDKLADTVVVRARAARRSSRATPLIY